LNRSQRKGGEAAGGVESRGHRAERAQRDAVETPAPRHTLGIMRRLPCGIAAAQGHVRPQAWSSDDGSEEGRQTHAS
jgi:hypothetical protein